MIAKPPRRPAESYIRLVRRFPLREIRGDTEYDAALRLLARLTGRDAHLDHGERDYARALSVLVGQYERDRYSFKARSLDPLGLLKFLMRENAMTVADLGRIIGTQSGASMIFNGRRGISKDVAGKLAAHFGLSIAAFVE